MGLSVGAARRAEALDDAAYGIATGRPYVVALLADETATDSVNEGDIGAARMTLDRKAINTPYTHLAGGATTFKQVAASTTNAASIKGSAAKLYSAVVNNQNAAVRYLKLYNKATSPTVGTDVPVLTLAVQPGRTETFQWPNGLDFPTGLAMALTTGATDADSTAVTANEHVTNISYA